ncbi:3-oxoacyl-ACP synthase III family protein [Niveispirillum cyanobacteriorum]|uniref:Ketoacyl-ACP synthase III n=1 Tax=Niveispirillum cyanobacteriorum TaxID=1612173 RepID=A0A2K9NFZ7_9PROT|nr:ketoacyl-ACP synthase III [Niveispirillum cyanobacteriorum]AUN32050.1 ketoacyl-ACP synthase III [Niveispirillum cyanobacteriorum]GGE73744.1 3-oxoacyl-ACP synthase [Niveispirillum cyanobacteriorum]
MAQARINGIALRGIVSALPVGVEDVTHLAARFGTDQAERIAAATGIHRRHIAAPSQCMSDLALPAARDLLDRLGWGGDSVDLLICVTQTPDHPLPATACLLQHRLGLGKQCAAFDVGLGCSGYVYGLWLTASLLAGMGRGRALLVAGDTTSRTMAPDDRSVAPLFGDAATVTALEWDLDGSCLTVDTGTDGAGAPYLIQPGGGARQPDGPLLFMDGTQVFAFTLREVPKTIAATLTLAGSDIKSVDHVVLHQANEMMLRRLGAKIGAREDQLVMALADRGNTSSATIPLAMTDALSYPLMSGKRTLLLCGFGVGWSWGTAVWTTGPARVCRTILVDQTSTVIPAG